LSLIISYICHYRKLFENFDPSSIAQFTEKNLVTPKINGNPLLSEQKLRAIVENAKQLLKVTSKFFFLFQEYISMH
jgi:DNA-3-methyladenine glycosylase I